MSFSNFSCPTVSPANKQRALTVLSMSTGIGGVGALFTAAGDNYNHSVGTHITAGAYVFIGCISLMVTSLTAIAILLMGARIVPPAAAAPLLPSPRTHYVPINRSPSAATEVL